MNFQVIPSDLQTFIQSAENKKTQANTTSDLKKFTDYLEGNNMLFVQFYDFVSFIGLTGNIFNEVSYLIREGMHYKEQ